MKYHALIKTEETGELYEFNYENLDAIEENIVIPYLKNEDFQFNGYFIDPAKVKRLIISETSLASMQCVDDAYSNLSPGIILFIGEADCVFGDERYSTDITRTVLKRVQQTIESPGQSNSHEAKVENAPQNLREPKTIFLGYSYREIDDEFVSGFKELLIDRGYKVIDGKASSLGSISQAILEKIALSDMVVIVMTKRDKKENGKFTTSAWLLEEKGAAFALKRDVGMFVEEEIDDADIGGIQGDNQRFTFTRNNFLKVAMNFLKIIEANE